MKSVYLLAGSALVMGTPVLAASGTGSSTAALFTPFSVVQLDDLSFGSVALSAGIGGDATMNPNDDSFTGTGGLLSTGGVLTAAEFVAVSGPSLALIATIPDQITLTRSGGTETLTLTTSVDTTWIPTGDVDANPLTDQYLRFAETDGSTPMKMGGTMTIANGQVAGLYEGAYVIDISYN